MTVRGWVVSKEPVTLKKAARIMSSFAARDNLAPQDVTNYLKRAAAAFDELLQFHRDLRQGPNPGSFRSDDAAAGDGEPSARKPETGESFGGKEPRKEKKRDESGSKPPENGGAKVGFFREERRVDGVSEVLDVKASKGKGRKIIVAGEMVEVRKLGGSAMVAVEESVQVAVEGIGEKAQVDGVDEQRSKVKRKEKKKNSEDNKVKMNNIGESEEHSKKEKIKNKEGDEQRKKEEQEKEKRKNSEEGEEQNKIEKRKRKSVEAEQEENKKSKRRRNEQH